MTHWCVHLINKAKPIIHCQLGVLGSSLPIISIERRVDNRPSPDIDLACCWMRSQITHRALPIVWILSSFIQYSLFLVLGLFLLSLSPSSPSTVIMGSTGKAMAAAMAAASSSSSLSSSSAASPRFRTWPITAVKSLEPELHKMGLKVPAERIDGTSSSRPGSGTGNCLSDALVSVGASGRGGTGSFVSKDGLILTNWHVAYDAVRQASLKGPTDYLTQGFVARSRSEELGDLKLECWITQSCQDVSERIVPIISTVTDPLQRADRVRDIMQEIAQAAQSDDDAGGHDGGQDATGTSTRNNGNSDSGKRCDVQEMLPNESYVLFTYKRIKDVRIVYVPPKSLGNFGGDTDNFEWPRHTADFTVLRAYVAPDGVTPAEYSPDNIPYNPQSYLTVQKDGASEGDFVFLLGFPGQTMRYAPTSRLRYSDEVAVPKMVKDFARKLELIAKYEKDSPEAALLLGTSKKGLANEFKRSKGKLVMMRKLGLMTERAQEEEQLRSASPEAEAALNRLALIYNELESYEKTSSALEACRGVYRGSALLATAHSLHEYLSVEMAKPDSEREAGYRNRNLPLLIQRLAKGLTEIYDPHEAALIHDAILTLDETPEMNGLYKEVMSVFDGNIDLESLEAVAKDSVLRSLKDPDVLKMALHASLDGSTTEIQAKILADPFVRVASALWPMYKEDRDRTKSLLSERDALFAKLLDAQRKNSDGNEILYPDCNGSLRLSAGYVEGYSPADAIWAKPRTTLAGLLDKAVEAKLSGDATRKAEFSCPERLYEMLTAGTEESASIAKVPVCMLYSTDTVGGNSGSPVLNADGEFVGINFDRQRQGLMNEFKWSKDYSRSIATDVRLILWLMGEYDGASDLVEEMTG